MSNRGFESRAMDGVLQLQKSLTALLAVPHRCDGVPALAGMRLHFAIETGPAPGGRALIFVDAGRSAEPEQRALFIPCNRETGLVREALSAQFDRVAVAQNPFHDIGC